MNNKIPITSSPAEFEIPEKPGRNYYYIIFLCLMIGIVSFIRYRLIDVSFERDEGEYGYIGNLLLHGAAIYKNAYSMKLPGTAFMYAIFMTIFGHTNSGVHTGLMFVNAATMCFLFAAFKKIFNSFVGLATASIYGIMATSFVFNGFAAHATHFICFYSSIALLFLAGYMKTGRVLKIFLCGLMFGMAFLMKQQAVFLILFGALFLFIYLRTEKKLGMKEIVKALFLFGLGVFIPYAVVLLLIVCTGQFSIFWLWTVEYAMHYERVKSLQVIYALFILAFMLDWYFFYYIWILAFCGILVLFMTNYTRIQKLFIILYFIASVCVVSAGFYFREHYYIVVLPALGLLTGIFIEFIVNKTGSRIKALKSPYVSLILLAVVISFTMYINRKYFFTYDSTYVSVLTYTPNPFNEVQEISKYISDNTSETDKIAVIGSEPEIYFDANRPAATGYLYTYPLVEDQPYNEQMQEEMINEIEKNKPVYIVYCNFHYSWLQQNGTPETIFTWSNKFLNQYYNPVGFADLDINAGWQIYWGNDMIYRVPQPEFLVILRRKNGM